MSTLQPTPSRGRLRRVPLWAVAGVTALLGIALVGGGLLLTSGDDSGAAPQTPVCTPDPAATTPPTATVEVNVFNATDRDGLAGRTAEDLELRGFEVDEVANDPRAANVRGTALVRHLAGAETAARWVAAQIPDARLRVVEKPVRGAAEVDLVLGERFDGLADVPAAQAAFAASAPDPVC